MEEKENFYDVIIIGAGPAGLACAAGLRESGLRILLLEQKSVIGPKVCAGGLTRRDIKHLRIPGRLLDREFRALCVHAPLGGATVRDRDPMISTVDRRRFAEWQLQKLAGAPNVTIRKNCQVTAIDSAQVTAGGTSCRYRFLVGADGSFSLVRRHLGLATEKSAIAIQYLVPTDKFRNLEFFLDGNKFQTWYAWIFPHRGYASIGCMCDPKFLDAKILQKNFRAWLRKNRIDVTGGRFEGYAINYDYRGFKFGRTYLAGDAAGLASGLTGEGIYQAIVSGEEVAKSILNDKYEAPGIAELLTTKRLHAAALRFVLRLGPGRDLFFLILSWAVRNRRLAARILRYVS